MQEKTGSASREDGTKIYRIKRSILYIFVPSSREADPVFLYTKRLRFVRVDQLCPVVHLGLLQRIRLTFHFL